MIYSRVLILLFALFSINAAADKQQHADILAPIYTLFDGMRESDGDKVRAAFSSEAIMYRAHSALREGSSPEAFASAVESKGERVWDEKIWDIQVKLDDKLASVWTEFAFYLDGELSHCGVNSFQLYHFDDGWKIIYLVDTFQKKGCEQRQAGTESLN